MGTQLHCIPAGQWPTLVMAWYTDQLPPSTITTCMYCVFVLSITSASPLYQGRIKPPKAVSLCLTPKLCFRYCGFPHVPVMSPPHMFPACMTKLLTGLLVCLSPFSEWQWGHCVSSYIAQTVPLCQGSWPESHHTKKGYAVLTNVMLCTCTSFLPTLKSGCFFLRIGLFDALSKTTWDCLACKWTMLQLGMGPISSIRDGQYSDFSSGQGKYHNYHNYCCNEIFKDVKP